MHHMDGGTPDASAKASHRRLKSIFATKFTPNKETVQSTFRASWSCPLRSQLSCALGQNNGVHLTKMLTVKIGDSQND
jgi:hypothetical protein